MVFSTSSPQIIRLGAACDPFRLFNGLPSSKTRVLLESARTGVVSGGLSFIASDPIDAITIQAGRRSADPLWKKLKKGLAHYRAAGCPAYPFEGGFMGYLSYECKDLIEPSLETSHAPDPCLPLAHFSLFDHAIIVDHTKNETLLAVMDTGKPMPSRFRELKSLYGKKYAEAVKRIPAKRRMDKKRPSNFIECSMDSKKFQEAVLRAKAYIRRGDVFQVNLAQRFRFPVQESAGHIYQTLRKLNPSPFFGIYDAVDFQIVSGSPERLLKLHNRLLETRPIAGTRARGKNDAEDKKNAQELMLSPKERAEHVMLVDLERNDLGRVAEYGSVEVDELMSLENYSHVKHIVSNIRAVLRQDLDAVDALKAIFPGGTITGAPKIRSMQIIDELEPVRRGPYTGSLGYLSFSGNMDMNILIRSLVIQGGMGSLHVGAGIVADSDPEKEYEETLYKAEAVLCAVFGKSEVDRFYQRCGFKRGAA